MPSVWVLQHVACEEPGTITDVLGSRGISVRLVRTHECEEVPRKMVGADGLIVMGGPMGVYEQSHYPFLSDEMCLIESALREQKPILGICLGSQLLAAALGAAVTPGEQKEIGWYRVALTEAAQSDTLWTAIDRSFMAYVWHGDIFEVPRDAVSLASSDVTACQGFRYGGNAYGFLFHMETTEKIMQNMLRTFSDELRDAGVNAEEIARRAASYLPRLQQIGQRVFQRWAGLVQTE